LDYREAVAFYEGALQTVVRGGDHTLVSFPEHVPDIVEWARS
ncbi:MAG: YqiA/YcfP family alpha/beta fold hydrolase, partial [Usitatibacter sp.]